jgi:transposase, IS5 family
MVSCQLSTSIRSLVESQTRTIAGFYFARRFHGCLYILLRLGLTDRETVELITESPYLQFFIGLSGYQASAPLEPSMMVHFCNRIGADLIKVCKDMTRANGIAMNQELLAESHEENEHVPEEQKLQHLVELGYQRGE